MQRLTLLVALTLFSPGVRADTPKPLTKWTGQPVLSPDGKLVANKFGVCHLVEVGSGEKRATLAGHAPAPTPGDPQPLLWINEAAFSPDSKWIATAARDGVVIIWDCDTGKELRRLQQHKVPLTQVVFSADGKQLASGDIYGAVKIWDTATGQCTATFPGYKKAIVRLAFSPNGETLVSADEGRRLFIRDLTKGKLVASLMTRTDVKSFAFHPDGKSFAAGTFYDVHLWETRTGKTLRFFPDEQTTSIFAIGFLNGGRILVNGSKNYLYYRDLEQEGKKVGEQYVFHANAYDRIASMSADVRLLAFLHENREIHFVPIPQTPPPLRKK